MSCVNSRQNAAQADFSSRNWWQPLAGQSQRRRRAPLLGSLLVGCFHQSSSSSVINAGKNAIPRSVIIIIIIIIIMLCVMNVFVLGAPGFHPAHSGFQHWTDLQPLVPPCHRYNPIVASCNAVNVPGSAGDMLNYASSYILQLIMVNLFIYCMFYLAMKLVSGERPTCWVKEILSVMLSLFAQAGLDPFRAVGALQLCGCLLLCQQGEDDRSFTGNQQVVTMMIKHFKDQVMSMAMFREMNGPCVLFDFYSRHDVSLCSPRNHHFVISPSSLSS